MNRRFKAGDLVSCWPGYTMTLYKHPHRPGGRHKGPGPLHVAVPMAVVYEAVRDNEAILLWKGELWYSPSVLLLNLVEVPPV